jgi:hypothetical protein
MKRLVLPACLLALSFNAQAAEIEIAVDCGITITSDVAMKRIYYRATDRSVKYKISKIPNLLTATLPTSTVSDLTVGEVIVVNKYTEPKDVFKIDDAIVAEHIACQNPGIEPEVVCPIDFGVNQRRVTFSFKSIDPITGERNDVDAITGEGPPRYNWSVSGDWDGDGGPLYISPENENFVCRNWDTAWGAYAGTHFLDIVDTAVKAHTMTINNSVVSSEYELYINTSYGKFTIESEYLSAPINAAEAQACKLWILEGGACVTEEYCETNPNVCDR